MELWFKFGSGLQKVREVQDFDSMTLRQGSILAFKKQGEVQAIYDSNAKAMYENILKYMDCGMVILDGETHEIVETEKIKAMNSLMQNEDKYKVDISAKQHFTYLGYLQLENDENTLGFIRELRHNKYGEEYVKVIFDKRNKEYSVYTLTIKDDIRSISNYNVDCHLHQAIQKQIEELHWYE